MFAHAFEGGSQLVYLPPGGFADDRIVELQLADAFAFLGQSQQRMAEAVGEADGDDQAESEADQADQDEEQEILPTGRVEIVFGCENADPDALGAAVHGTEMAEPAPIRLGVAVQDGGLASALLPGGIAGTELRHVELFGRLEQGPIDCGLIGEAGIVRRCEQQSTIREQCGLAMHAWLELGGVGGDVAEAQIMPDDVMRSVRCLPAHGSRDAGFLRGVEDVGRRPESCLCIVQGHGALEPRPGARVVVAPAHFDLFDLPLCTPAYPVGLVAPVGRVADAIEPMAVGAAQQEKFAARFVGENDRGNVLVIGQDREKQFVEALQLAVVECAVAAPVATVVQADLDAFEEAVEACLELLRNQLHLGFGETVDGRPAE